MNRMTKIALAVGLSAALALPAGQALAASKTENALIGAAIGALAGGLIGNGSTTAILGGAAAGAAVGIVTDKDNDRRRRIAGAPVYSGGFGQPYGPVYGQPFGQAYGHPQAVGYPRYGYDPGFHNGGYRTTGYPAPVYRNGYGY